MQSQTVRRRSFTRSLAMAVLALGCALLAGCGAQAAATRATASNAPLVHLPADQANHPKVNNEWWYVVGHLHHGNRTFGYEMTVFRLFNVKASAGAVPVSLYRTDIAITDEQNHAFHQKVQYYFPQSASTSARQLAVHVGSANLVQTGSRSMRLNAHNPAGTLTLDLTEQRPPMYVGGRGYLPFANGFTYYYSLTDLATHGTLRLGGTTYTVDGMSWLDHQWGNWSWRVIRGWTWMALQLNNGIQLSVFDFKGGRRERAASILERNGQTATVRTIGIQSSGSWHSPHTGARYPTRWTVRIPARKAVLHIQPSVQDQELTSRGLKAGSYWEGSGRITGTWQGRPVHGVSYTELVGYAAGFAG